MRVLDSAGCAICLKPCSENQVSIVTLGIFVDRAEVVGLFSVLGVVLLGAGNLVCHHCGRLSGNVQDGEVEEEILADLLFESLFLFVPL